MHVGIEYIYIYIYMHVGECRCCIVTTNYTYTYACRNIFNTIKMSGHSSLEKYTTHFIERVVCERELETEQNCNILTPTLMAKTAFLSRSTGLLNLEPGAQHLWDMVLIPASSLQLLNRESWGPPLLGAGSLYSILSPTNLNFLCTELYYCFTPIQFNPSTVIVIPWRPWPDAPVTYTGAFLILTAWLGWRSIYNTGIFKDVCEHKCIIYACTWMCVE